MFDVCSSVNGVIFFLLGVVTREMFDSMSNAEVIGTLTKEFNEVRKEKAPVQT